jgi:hypothetical protein
VEATAGHSLIYDELAILTNEPRSTLGRWFNGDGEPSSECLLRLLELSSESRRREIMDKPPFCRVYPRLEHPWLAHDPATLSHLRTIVSTSTGITLIRGDDESRVTFLITALGHAARDLPNLGRKVGGLDIHEPDWFVPVPEITYLNNQLHPSQIREELDRLRPKIISSKGSFLILNGTFSHLSASQSEIFQDIARHSHVAIALRPCAKDQPAALGFVPTHVVTVTVNKIHPERLVLDIQAA